LSNYSNLYGHHRDTPRGAFGKPASQCRIDLSNELNELGDALHTILPQNLSISVKGTISMGKVFRIDKWYLKDKQKQFEINRVLFKLGYHVAKEDKTFIYVKKGEGC
jgi:hypothetical protein